MVFECILHLLAFKKLVDFFFFSNILKGSIVNNTIKQTVVSRTLSLLNEYTCILMSLYVFQDNVLIKKWKLLWPGFVYFPICIYSHYIFAEDESYYLHTCGSNNPIRLRWLFLIFKAKLVQLFLFWYVFVLPE